jgi:hypothetical protein
VGPANRKKYFCWRDVGQSMAKLIKKDSGVVLIRGRVLLNSDLLMPPILSGYSRSKFKLHY